MKFQHAPIYVYYIECFSYVNEFVGTNRRANEIGIRKCCKIKILLLIVRKVWSIIKDIWGIIIRIFAYFELD